MTLYGRTSSPESDKIIEELCEIATELFGKYQRQFKFIDGKFE